MQLRRCLKICIRSSLKTLLHGFIWAWLRHTEAILKEPPVLSRRPCGIWTTRKKPSSKRSLCYFCPRKKSSTKRIPFHMPHDSGQARILAISRPGTNERSSTMLDLCTLTCCTVAKPSNCEAGIRSEGIFWYGTGRPRGMSLLFQAVRPV